MLKYQSINNLLGWLVFIISTAVYTLTVEPTASFWDCGEFIAVSYKLMVPHPPGAPFFLLIGRIFSLFAPDKETVALCVNMVSVISSSLTVMFLFWTITLLAKKFFTFNGTPDKFQTVSIMGAGLIGSLAFTFSDSFWFSAVEAEVYAMSSFFTAFAFWAILKWEEKYESPDADKWLLIIAYSVGLSIGVHLLNLLTIPALAYVYYFKKYQVNNKGLIYTFLLSAVIILVILVGIIPGLPSLAGKFELFFVNSLGLGFSSGIIFFGVIFVATLIFAINYSIKKENRLLNTSLLAFTFILIGYISYGIIPIRSNFDPPIDENDPENVISMVSYLKREQYGDRPLLLGPLFTAGYPIKAEKAGPLYRQDTIQKEYVIYDYKMEYEYDKNHMMLLPRAYSIQPHHIEAYKSWMNLRGNKKPTFFQDKKFMFEYQFGHMFFRYFLWNFVGRESDIQDAGVLDPSDWFKKGLPEQLMNNKARNNFFMLPLILGLIGMFHQFSKRKLDGFVVLLLFLFTGLAIVFYLNQPPVEPRERDYTFAGAFYAFSIWIGLGVLLVTDLLQGVFKQSVLAPALATVLCLSVPTVMAAQGWDDHDRSGRYHSVDSAKNLLNSCAPNAIIFTGGDNDTFPLWYVQEVEGFRTDVRVCNLSLLNTDWYIEQMKQKAYESEPLPITLTYNNYIQGQNDQLYYEEKPEFKNSGINLQAFIKLVKANSREVRRQTQSGDSYTVFPSKKFFLYVNKDEVMQNKALPEKYMAQFTDKMVWSLSQNTLEKKDLIMLDIIANNHWKRPIYFSTTLSGSNFLNLKDHMELEGLAFRLLPAKFQGASQGVIATDIMKENMMKKFYWRGLDNPNVYYDENFLRFPVNSRSQFYRLAVQLVGEGRKEEAKEVMNYCLKVMPDNTIPYDVAMPGFITLFFKVGEEAPAMDIANKMSKRAIENLAYYRKNKMASNQDYQLNLYILDEIINGLKAGGKNTEAAKLEESLRLYSSYY